MVAADCRVLCPAGHCARGYRPSLLELCRGVCGGEPDPVCLHRLVSDDGLLALAWCPGIGCALCENGSLPVNGTTAEGENIFMRLLVFVVAVGTLFTACNSREEPVQPARTSTATAPIPAVVAEGRTVQV